MTGLNKTKTSSLDQIKGIGSKLLAKFEKLGILKVEDLLFHLPRDYQDRTTLDRIKDLSFDQTAQVEGHITQAQVIKTRRKMLKVLITDDSNQPLEAIFFNFYPSQVSQLQPKVKIRLYGYAKYQSTIWQMVHPEYQILYPNRQIPLADRLTPIYPTTEGLSSQIIAKFIKIVLENPSYKLKELLPQWLCQKYKLTDLYDALIFIHTPPKNTNLNQLKAFQYPSQQRLIIEELIAHRLSVQVAKLQNRQFSAYKALNNTSLVTQLLQQMPFKPTNAQLRVIDEIKSDLAQVKPMARLVQGDVGSGKTLVAAAACAMVVESKYQASIMAPTEILAQQHFDNFKKWFEPLSVNVELITNKTTQKQRQTLQEQLQQGTIDILIGTHAIFQQGIEFKNLSLVIIDEQHRFGVQQRYDLLSKGIQNNYYPHQLVMSATPIPRTLTMTIYGDLDISIIDELPKGRLGINTVAFSNKKRAELIAKLKDEFQQGLQAYWVCPLIEESEALSELQAAENLLQVLKEAFNGIEVKLIHGKMKPKEKLSIMEDFKSGRIQLLVATTVIEVGVDVPNASVMVIENPERLGLSQLHQLRGRVGRGKLKGTCILLYHPSLSETAKKRLNVMRESNDGFIIAEKDLSLRGPGELLGTKQTGNINFKVADLMRDHNQLPLISQLTDLITTQEPEIIPLLIERWLGDGLKFKQT